MDGLFSGLHLLVLAAIAFGLVIGAWQGFWVAFVGIPGFIVTLAGMLLFRVLYYLVPFILSVILLSLRELIVGLRA